MRRIGLGLKLVGARISPDDRPVRGGFGMSVREDSHWDVHLRLEPRV